MYGSICKYAYWCYSLVADKKCSYFSGNGIKTHNGGDVNAIQDHDEALNLDAPRAVMLEPPSSLVLPASDDGDTVMFHHQFRIGFWTLWLKEQVEVTVTVSTDNLERKILVYVE